MAELDAATQALRANEKAFQEALDPFVIEQLTYQHAALRCRSRVLLRLLKSFLVSTQGLRSCVQLGHQGAALFLAFFFLPGQVLHGKAPFTTGCRSGRRSPH